MLIIRFLVTAGETYPLLSLSDQSSYQGGILQLQTGQNGEDFRCSAGEVVVYPSSCLHCVSRLPKGRVRLCGVD